MYTRKKLRLALNIALAATLIIACEKQNDPATPASTKQNTKTTAGLVSGPPTIVAWLKGPNIPTPSAAGRKDAYGFSIDGKGYMGGGILIDSSHNEVAATDFWCWDPATGTWSQQASFLGTARGASATFVAAGKGYVCTGNNWLGGQTRSSKETWLFDPSTNWWLRKKNFPGPARLSAVGASINGMGYVGTGQSGPGDATGYNDWYQYDPSTDTWTRKADLPAQYRWAAVAFQSGTKAYITGGTNYSHGDFTGTWAYDPTIDTWKARAEFPGICEYSVGLSIPDDGVVVSGGGGDYTSTQCWFYNFSNNTWTQGINSPGGGRSEAGGFAIGGSIFIFGGVGANGTYGMKNDFWGIQLE
jgi:N-acetylneuraminic acid mutarotase